MIQAEDQTNQEAFPARLEAYKKFFSQEVSIIRAKDRHKIELQRFKSYSYFSFGSQFDPTSMGLGPLKGIVEYVNQFNDQLYNKELQQEESLTQNTHLNMDIYSFVMEGQLRQDNYKKDNNQIHQGDFIYLHTNDTEKEALHREANSGTEFLKLLQIFIEQKDFKDPTISNFSKQEQSLSPLGRDYKILYKFVTTTVTIENNESQSSIILQYQGSIEVQIQKKNTSTIYVLDEKDLLIIKGEAQIQLQPIKNQGLECKIFFIQLP